MLTTRNTLEDSFGSRFEILGALGSDAHGVLARDHVRGHQVVLHVFAPSELPAGVRMRLDEAASLTGVEIISGASHVALVRPFVDGTPASELPEVPPVDQLVAMIKASLAALGDLHRAGIVHGNLKPSNVIVGPANAISLVDSALSWTERPNISIEAFPLEAVRYLAPEQAGLLRRSVGPAADLYALGLVWFELLTGTPAFAGDHVGAILNQHLQSELPDVRDLGVRVPRALAEILRRMLREDPDERYQSAAAVLADVEAVATALSSGVLEPAVVVGAHDLRSTLTEPGFVGLQRELAELDRLLAAAREGRRVLAFVEGESGSGKTRLLQELATRARAGHARVFRGQAREHTVGRPFEALASAMTELSAYTARDPQLRPQLGERLGERRLVVLASLPQLEPALGPGERIPPVREALAGVRALDALSALLDSVADADHPAVIVLDDMQWADPSTIRLVSHWASQRDAAPSHTMLVCAFRSEELPEDSTLRRVSLANVVRLDALADAEVGALLQSAAGPLPAPASAAVIRLAAGNPFIALAVLHGMVESGALAPGRGERGASRWTCDAQALARPSTAGVAAAVLTRRLELLPRETHALLELAAILGREFDLDRLAMLAERDGRMATKPFERLQIAIERHLLWPSPDGQRFAFVHDAVREALVASMDEPATLRLHRIAGRMIEDADPTAVFEIAFHFDAGREPDRALPYALAAAEQARRRRALATAARQYRIAERSMANASAATRKAVLVGLGEVLLLIGKYDESQRALERALPLATSPEEWAHVENLLADTDLYRGDARGAADRISTALRCLGHRVPTRLGWFVLGCIWQLLVQAAHTLVPRRFVGRGAPATCAEVTVVRLYSRLAYALYFVSTIPTVWAQLRELNLAERRAPGPELAQAWSNHAVLMSAVPRFGRALRYSEQAVKLRRQIGDAWGVGQALHFHARVQYAASRFSPAIASAREAMRLLESAGDRWEYDDAAAVEALCHFAFGDLSTAVTLAKKLHHAADEIGDVHPRALAVQVWARASGGDIPAELVRGALEAQMSHILTSSSLLVAEGVRRLARGEADAATEVLERAFAQVRQARLRVSHVVQIPLLLSSALRACAAKLPPWRPRERARLLARARRVCGIGLRAARSFQSNLPFALRETAIHAALRGHHRRAIRLLGRSAAIARQQGARYELAMTSLFLGQLAGPDQAEHAKRQLIALGAGFELAPSEKPIVLSLADRFAHLLESGRKIVRSLKRDDVFAATRAAALQTLRADACEIRAMSSIAELSESEEWRRLLAKAAHDGHAVVIPEALLNQSDTGYPSVGSRSAVWAPVFVHGRLAAALFVSYSRIRGLFAQDELAIVDFLTTLAGAALENSEGFARAEDAIRARDDFLQIASHEIRTPLTSFKLNLDLIERLVDREPGVEASVKRRMPRIMRTANRQIDRLAALLDQLIEASVVGTEVHLALEQVDLGALVRSIVAQLEPQIHAAATRVVIEPHDEIVGTWDPRRLRTVIANLLDNALKFGEHRDVLVTLGRHGSTAELRVRDFGLGVAPADQERLFGRLERAVSARHFGGLGLGLYIARRLVEAHAGTIRVESEGLGQGSTFIVELPLAGPRASPHA